MPALFYILFGAAFAAATSIALGRVLLGGLRLRFYRTEEYLLAFVTGSACLSAIVFALAAAHLARKGVFFAVGAAAIGAAIWRERRTGAKAPAPPLPHSLSPFWKALFGVVFSIFAVLYLFNAMAPEKSPDGGAYHLGVVAWYLRDHGFPWITTNIYANLSEGVEMLFLYAFAFGRHSSAALVHFSFLAALPLLMLSYARRFGFPAAGAAGALFFFLSPVVGIDGISAYIDVAVAAILFALFYLLQIWEKERNEALLIPVGLLAGFSYAAKYTAFLAVPYALGFVGWKLYRARRPCLKPLLTVSLCALAMILPWMAKNWIVVDNPFSPFLNRIFPSPYVHASFEQEYTAAMRNYQGLKSSWEIPLEVTVRGATLAGLLGPLFLLAPIGLFALREEPGRRLLLAGTIFGVAYLGNIGTRFLIPCAPFFSLAMGIALARPAGIAPLLVVAHALFSWPAHIKMYAAESAWRLETIPVRPALRLESEEDYLNARMSGYMAARMIEALVPEGEKVLSVKQIPQAYTSREILVGYQAAFNRTAQDVLQTPLVPDYQPTWILKFRFPAARLRKVRVVQTADGGRGDHWSISELRVFRGEEELRRKRNWRLRARPNPWDVQMAFDNSPVTRWRSWHALFSGMFVEVDFGGPETVDQVVLECSHDQYKVRLRLEGQTEPGDWRTLAGEPEQSNVQPRRGLRRAAADVLKSRGIHYLLLFDSDYGAADFRGNAAAWGVTPLGERGDARLYRLD